MALCLGTAQLGQAYGIFRKPDKETAQEILTSAIDGGIEYIDTAPVYGESESIIGEFLKTNAKLAKIITKIPKYKGKNSKDFVDHCKGSVIKSMRTLGRAQLWGVLLHDANNAKSFPDEVLGLKAWFYIAGVAPNFGVSLYEPSDVYHRLLGIYQIPLNLQDTRFIREIPAEDMFWRGCTIMVRSIYLQNKIKDYRKALRFARAAIEKRTRRNLLVIGAENADQVKMNIAMHEADKGMNEEEYKEILAESENPDLEKIDPRKWK